MASDLGLTIAVSVAAGNTIAVFGNLKETMQQA
jgi:hypothetical protein